MLYVVLHAPSNLEDLMHTVKAPVVLGSWFRGFLNVHVFIEKIYEVLFTIHL